MALLLRKQGVKRIRPLQGGLSAWRDRGYPLSNMKLAQISADPLSTPATNTESA